MLILIQKNISICTNERDKGQLIYAQIKEIKDILNCTVLQ